MISITEENYLKAIYKLMEKEHKLASTNAIAAVMNTSAASVTDMIKRLAQKNLVDYMPYKGVTLTAEGAREATGLIRKHRLWEVFLTEKLHFQWDEVHDIADELEHINSPELVRRLDEFLGKPKFDPHGDPIPNDEGKYTFRKQIPLNDLDIGDTAELIGVAEHSPEFLAHLGQMNLNLGSQFQIVDKLVYDGSTRIRFEGNESLVSGEVCRKLFVKKVSG